MDTNQNVANNAERYTVKSVARALKLVSIVADGPAHGLSLSELAKALGASKSTTLSMARTLVGAGYLSDAKPGPRYCLGTNLVRLGDIASQRLPLGDLCRPILMSLAEETRMTSRVAINDHGYPVFIDRVDGPGSVRFYTPLGQREIPYASAAGKALLSTFPESQVREICAETGLTPRTSHTITEIETLIDNLALARDRGFAVDDEEDAEGVFCASAAFFDHTGKCAGALSVTGIKGDLASWRVDEIGQSIKKYAEKITEFLNGTAHEHYIQG
ncbi:MAG: IclR family transcriptional regulator [Ferrimicrobium sp.]